MKKIMIMLALIFTQNGMAVGDPPSVHGMLLFGESTKYVSHLPMFHKPHDYQLIMQIDLEAVAGSEALVEYNLAKKSGSTLFTIVPEVMDLTKVISGEKKKFAVHIFNGHFERGGVNLGPAIINVSIILQSSKLDGAQSVKENDEYFVFGKGGEYYAAHLIKEKPSFDFIASVSQPYKINHQCGRGLCLEPKVIKINDNDLPITIKEEKESEGLNIPVEGQILGEKFTFFAFEITGALTDIYSIIYEEQNELAH